MKRASADVGFMFIVYNLRRLINIIGKTLLTKFLQELVLSFFEILAPVKAIIFKIRRIIFYTTPSQNIFLQAKIESNSIIFGGKNKFLDELTLVAIGMTNPTQSRNNDHHL